MHFVISNASKYHVTFFGDSVSRAWIASSMLKNFQEMAAEGLDLKKGKNKEYSKRFAIGLKMAEEAEKMNIQERIDKFGFSGRYRHNEESEQPGFREEDFDVCGNDKRHTTSTKITNCEQKSHAPNELPITATKEVENIGEKEDHTLQSKPVCQNEKKRPMFKKIRNCEPKLCLSKKSVTTMAKKVENIKEKDVHELESKPASGVKKHYARVPPLLGGRQQSGFQRSQTLFWNLAETTGLLQLKMSKCSSSGLTKTPSNDGRHTGLALRVLLADEEYQVYDSPSYLRKTSPIQVLSLLDPWVSSAAFRFLEEMQLHTPPSDWNQDSSFRFQLQLQNSFSFKIPLQNKLVTNEEREETENDGYTWAY
ncbi:zinc finger CW-type PWWP domain protein 1 [Ambystoma mexicanum]|uniref:zinc finger CW-type PWWP domain protein 1 n=1 Tax=Ambystoma mexicanum TaxID=8296 RepID=UPI0037E7B503